MPMALRVVPGHSTARAAEVVEVEGAAVADEEGETRTAKSQDEVLPPKVTLAAKSRI